MPTQSLTEGRKEKDKRIEVINVALSSDGGIGVWRSVPLWIQGDDGEE